jgi:ketosteroid isomerase-like protein
VRSFEHVSQGNVQRFHHLRRRLSEDHDLSREVLDEDAEWVNPDDAVEPGSRRGADSFLQAVTSVFEGWQESIFEIERVIDRGEDVIALGRLRTRGRATGIEATIPHGEIWTFDAGKVVRMCWFNTHAETLAAAGVDDEGDNLGGGWSLSENPRLRGTRR